jgi:integrase
MPTLIKKHNPPRWRAVVTVNGRRKEKLFPDGSEKSRRAAVKWETNQRKKLKAPPPPIDTGSVTWIELANAFLDFVKERQSRKTYGEKLGVMKRSLRRFGKESFVEDLTVADALAYLSDQYKKRSGYAANKERKVLVTAWNFGKKYMAGFPDGPCPFQQVDRFPEQRQPRYVPPEEDFWAVESVAEGQDRVMLLTLLFLAARKGEVFRLRWTDVDFAAGTVTLWTRKRAGGDFEPDVVPMVQRLKKVLLAWWEQRPIKAEHVFVNLDETPFCKQYLGQPFTSRQHLMERLCKKAGVRHFGFHAIRHLTASLLYREGQPVAVIQAVLRHKSPQTTTRYLQSLGLKQTQEAMEAVMGQRGPGKIIKLPTAQHE